VVITHNYGERKGVRYMNNGLKVYYLPIWRIYQQVTFPTIYSTFPLFRSIFLREAVDVVHGHQVIN
jgi:phosphatidylinositol glycan class A protein